MRTTLESGAWIEHVPIQDLKGKHKRNLDRVGKPRPVFSDGGDFDQAATMSGMDVMAWISARRDAIWAMVITSWSWDLPVPVLGDGGQVADLDSYGELPLGDFEEIEALMEPFAKKLLDKPDPKGVTTSASNGSSRASAGHGHPAA